MSIDTLLSHLSKVKRTGKGRYLACCPAHSDKHPSLSIRELNDGRVLIHCFTGCNVKEILRATGLEFDVLYPEKPIGHFLHPEKRSFSAKDILEAIRHESLMVSVAASKIAQGEALAKEDYKRLMLASRRLQAAGVFYE